MTDQMVSVSVVLVHTEAVALAQFVKRVGWSEMRVNAVDDQETCDIRAAIQSLRTAISEAGLAPR
jgi:hypothetical protein